MTTDANEFTESKSFEQFDKLNRKSFSIALTKAIKFDYPIQDGSFVLSLNAKFGSGKSTFLEMWQKDLKQQGTIVVQINAWESDFADNPFYPILASLNSVVKNDSKLTKCLRVAATITSHVINRQIEKLTNVNVKDLANDISELDEIGESILKAYMREIDCYENLKLSLKKYIDNQDNGPIFVLIDELDRARPDYAVRFLEIIKHFFSIKGLIFVIAIDKELILPRKNGHITKRFF